MISIINYKPEPYIEEVSEEDIIKLQQEKHIFGWYYARKADGTYIAFVRDARNKRTQSFINLEAARHWLGLGFEDSGGYPKYGGNIQPITNNKHYREHYLFVAHYAFSTPKFFQEIYLDPQIIFGGEEPTMAMRASTRGYRFFNISAHILWHFNKHNIKDPDDRLMDPGDPLLLSHYHYKNRTVLKRVRQILTGEILGYWGAPSAEALEAYEKAVDFSFKDFYQRVDNLR